MSTTVGNLSSTTSTSTKGGDEDDLKLAGIFFLVCGVVFLILAIVVPIVVVNKRDPFYCSPATYLNFAEQLQCIPKLADLPLVTYAEYPDLVKVYREKAATLKTVTRTMKYEAYKLDLKGEYDYFSISVPIQVEADLTVDCAGTSCDTVKMYWVNDSLYNKAISNGYFDEDLLTPEKVGFGRGDDVHLASSIKNTVYYLVFSNSQSAGVTVIYSITLTYTVYDVSKLKAQSCGAECRFEDIQSDEIVFMDYPSTSGAHEYFAADISYLEAINLGGALAAGIILGLVALFCFFLASIYMKKVLKKIVKKVKKIGKKASEEAEKKEQSAAELTPSTPSAPAATIEATPTGYPGDPSYQQQQPLAADPNVGQQAYPVQGEIPPAQAAYPVQGEIPPAQAAYPGQEVLPAQEMYPGQQVAPPAQGGYPAEADVPLPQQAYPGQEEAALAQV